MDKLSKSEPGTKLAKPSSDMKHETTRQNQLSGWMSYLNGEVAEEVKQAISETIFRNEAAFRKSTEENKRFIIQRLVKIFSFSLNNYKITPERVFLIDFRNQVHVSLHYLVYLKLAAEAGVRIVRFVRTERGEKVLLTHKDDGIKRSYFLDYDMYRERGGVWKTNFDVMFRKTLVKQAIMFLFPDVYENELFAQVANFDEADLVEPEEVAVSQASQALASEAPAQALSASAANDRMTSGKEAQEARRKLTNLYARVNKHISVFAKDKELYREVETFLALNGYKSVYDITNEEDLRCLHAMSEALAEQKLKGVDYNSAMQVRDKLLTELHALSKSERDKIVQSVRNILSKHSYTHVSEVGRVEVLEELLQVVQNLKSSESSESYETQKNSLF